MCLLVTKDLVSLLRRASKQIQNPNPSRAVWIRVRRPITNLTRIDLEVPTNWPMFQWQCNNHMRDQEKLLNKLLLHESRSSRIRTTAELKYWQRKHKKKRKRGTWFERVIDEGRPAQSLRATVCVACENA